MNFLERIWQITDDIFSWKGWHIFKWITGAIICVLVVYITYQLENGKEEELINKLEIEANRFPTLL